MSLLSNAHSTAGPAAFFPVYSLSPWEVGASLQVAMSSSHPSTRSAVKSAPGHSCTVPVLSLYQGFEPWKGRKLFNSWGFKMCPWKLSFLAQASKSQGWITTLHLLSPLPQGLLYCPLSTTASSGKHSSVVPYHQPWCWYRWIPTRQEEGCRSWCGNHQTIILGQGMANCCVWKGQIPHTFFFLKEKAVDDTKGKDVRPTLRQVFKSPATAILSAFPLG